MVMIGIDAHKRSHTLVVVDERGRPLAQRTTGTTSNDHLALVAWAIMLYAAFMLNRDHGRWWLALGGIASLIFGVLLVIEPLVVAVVLTMWIGAYAVVFGGFLLVLAFQLHSRKEERERKSPAGAKKA